MKSPIKLAIVDDDEIYRKVLLAHIDMFKDIEVVLQAANGKELLDALPHSPKPDMILLDLEMPVMGGKETLEHLCKAYPTIKALMLTMHSDDELFNYLIEKGANSFIPKEIGFTLIIEAIYTVKKAGYYFAHVDLKKIVAAKKTDKQNADIKNALVFTNREKEIIQLIYQGYTNKEISDKLFISQRTVDAHKYNMVQKAQVRNASNLMAFAIKNNLINNELLL